MEPITKEEADDMRDVLARFYGSQTKHWKINSEVYELFGQLVSRSASCTEAVHLLPRPYSGAPTVKWASRQIRKALTRYFKSTRGEHYLMCMRSAALAMRTEIQLAATSGM